MGTTLNIKAIIDSVNIHCCRYYSLMKGAGGDFEKANRPRTSSKCFEKERHKFDIL